MHIWEHISSSDQLTKNFRYFLLILSLTASALVYLATSQLGPGLGEDSAKYLSAAENLVSGTGLFYYNGYGFNQWPPLYPALLSGLHLLTNIDLIIIAQALNILAVGALVFASGLLLETALPQRLLLAVFGSVLIAFSTPIIAIASNISTDPLFILLVILFLLASTAYTRKAHLKYLLAMAFLSIAATYLRYAGLALVLSGGVIVLFMKREFWIKAISGALLFVLATGMPLILWVYLYNYPQIGKLFGGHLPASPLNNVIITIEKIFGWFLPQIFLNTINPFLLLIILFVIVLTGNRRADWIGFFQKLIEPHILSSMIFLIIYSGMLIFSTSSSETRHLGFDRIHIVILPALLVVGLNGLETLFPKYLYKLPEALLSNMIIIALTGIAFISVYDAQKYARSTAEKGDIYYNNMNTQELRQSEFTTFLNSIELQNGDSLYSNNDSIAWYYVRHPITIFPRDYGRNDGEPTSTLDWPEPGEDGVLVWLHGNLDYTPGVFFPEDALEMGWISQIYSSDAGDVYQLNRESDE